MKYLKIFLIIFILIFSTNNLSAEELYSCSVPENLTPTFNRVVTNMLGFNLLAKQIAKTTIKHVLKRNAKGEYNVKIDSFSAIDLKRGKFKSLEITGENISTNGMYISFVKLRTLCDYNYVDYNHKPVIFHTDLPLYFETIITEDDLNRTFIDLNTFKKIGNVNLYGISVVSIDNVSFKLKNNKVYLIVKVKLPLILGEKLVKFTFSGKLNVENGKIVFEDIHSDSLRNINMQSLIEKITNAKLFDIPIQMFEGHESVLSVNNVKTLDNKIYMNGTIVVKRYNNESAKEKK